MLLLFLFHQLFEMTCSPLLPLLLDNSSLEHAPWRVFVLLHCLFQPSSTPGLLFRSTPGLLFRSTQSPAFLSPCRLVCDIFFQLGLAAAIESLSFVQFVAKRRNGFLTKPLHDFHDGLVLVNDALRGSQSLLFHHVLLLHGSLHFPLLQPPLPLLHPPLQSDFLARQLMRTGAF